MNQFSVTITASSYAELAQKICESADLIRGTLTQQQAIANPAAVTPTASAASTTPVQAVPTSAPSYTVDDLSRAASPLIDAGKQTDLVNLLAQFGVQAVTQLPKERYGEFATALRSLGAKI